MKASLKFRDDQKPLVRAKVPLSILGMPFQSGIVAGESKELSLNLSTFFESGPAIKLAYRPNDSWNPFSLVIKTGTGPFGSPSSSSMLMSAEFNLVGKGNPSFMLHFKPRFGDFSIKKSQSSSAFEKSGNVIVGSLGDSIDEGSIEVVDSPVMNGHSFAGINGFSGKKISGVPQPTARAIVGAFSGVEVAASTQLPVRNHAVMNFRWGVRVPAEIKGGIGADSAATFNLRKIPFLVMNKIGIEHVDDSKSKQKSSTLPKLGDSAGNTTDIAETCFAVKRQLEVLQSENGLLKKAVDDLRQEIAAGNFSFPAQDFNSGRYSERNGAKNVIGSRNERRGHDKKSEGDVNEELKKALKGASNVGA
ncbi:uncharacterized protein [Euphorbia lathyris]|uniref:uncharacterized protein n=1 Tax=Euphorbia lathyris TaxID=212925 RepID=UPI003313A430